MSERIGNSVGELLRATREAKNLTLDEANRETKISVEVLTSLEQDDFDAVGSDIYLKGFLKNYARFLGIDSQEVLKTLDRQRGKGVFGVGTMWDIEESVTEERLESPRLFRRFVLPLLLLVILILTILFINERNKNSPERLPPADTQGYLESETVDSRST